MICFSTFRFHHSLTQSAQYSCSFPTYHPNRPNFMTFALIQCFDFHVIGYFCFLFYFQFPCNKHACVFIHHVIVDWMWPFSQQNVWNVIKIRPQTSMTRTTSKVDCSKCWHLISYLGSAFTQLLVWTFQYHDNLSIIHSHWICLNLGDVHFSIDIKTHKIYSQNGQKHNKLLFFMWGHRDWLWNAVKQVL